MSCIILPQSIAGGITVFLEEFVGGGAAIGLTRTDVVVDLKKEGSASFVNKDLTPVNATGSIGSGTNGTVNIEADGSLIGAVGNGATVQVVDPSPVNGPLTVSVGVFNDILVTLAVTGGVLDAAANTATLVAAAIDAEADFSATASGSGVDALATDEGPNPFSGGVDFWAENGDGTYTITLTQADTDTLGSLYVRVSGPTIKTSLNPASIVDNIPTAAAAVLPIQTTTLFGYIVDAQGDPLSGASVSARVLATPSVGFSVTEGYVQGENLATSKSDSSGFFLIDLVTGSEVDFYIPAANYRRTLQVPASSQNVFDIP